MISVIIPVYNAASFIDKIIENIRRQTYQDFELILVDDCSDDGTVEVINHFVTLDSRIKVICKSKREGQSRSREVGLEASQGEYILFLDHDDTFHDRLFEILVREQKDSDLVVAGAMNLSAAEIDSFVWVEDVKDDMVTELEGNQATQIVLDKPQEYSRMLGAIWGILISKSYLKEIEAKIYCHKEQIPIVYFEDVHVTHQMFHYAKSIRFINESLILHLVSNKTLSRQLKPTAYGYDVIDAADLKMRFIYEHGYNGEKSLVGFYLSILKAWWQTEQYEDDLEVKSSQVNKVLKYYERYYKDLIKLKPKSFGEAAVIRSIRLFHFNRKIWKYCVGNVYFKVLY